MKLTNVEKKEKNLVVLNITVEADVFAAACERSYRKNVGSINIQGFRKGKAPRKIIEKLYGPEIFYDDAMNECIPDAFEAAVAEAGLKVVSQPSITAVDVQDGEFLFTAEVYVKPEVALKEYKGLEVEKEETEVAAEEVEAELARMQARNARQVSVERESKKGDVVNLDFDGSVDGVAFEGGKGEKFDLELGSGMFIPGFEEQLEGKNVGDECDVTVTFPEDYQEKSLAGKPAVFKCKINEIKENQKPELDDEFAKDVSEFDTFAELKADVEKKLQESKAERAETAYVERVMDKVIEGMEAEIPDAMVETQLDRVAEDFSYRLAMQGMDFQTYLKMTGMDQNMFRQVFTPQALRQVKIRLALEKVAELEGLDVTEEDLNAEFDKLAENNKMDINKVKELLAAEDLKMDMVCQKAHDLILENTKAVPMKKAEEKAAE